jgi:cytochrome o ubiquinol oxidase subunit 2
MSANYSGAGFSDMYFNVDAVPTEKFAQWVAAARTNGPVLDAQSYAALAKPSQAVAPSTFRAVAPDLFTGILSTTVRSRDSSGLTDPASQRAEK